MSKWIAEHRVLSAIIVLAVALVCQVVNSPPGGEDTDKQPPPPTPTPPPPSTTLERLHLQWNSEDYPNWPAADDLAVMSRDAYLPPIEAVPAYKMLGFDEVETFVDASLVGYVVTSEDTCVIVFRGTDDAGDWLVNLNSLSTGTPHGPIHRGFLQAYTALRPQIMAALKKRPNLKHIWITGHSLGGALALVCAYDLEENSDARIDGIMTFGQPMVARSQLATHLDERFFQRYAHFVNDADIVPRVPPGHSHCGSLVWFTQNGIRRSKPREAVVGADKDAPPAEDTDIQPLSDQEFERLKSELRNKDSKPKRNQKGEIVVEGNAPWLRDHSMGLYLEKLRAISQPTERN